MHPIRTTVLGGIIFLVPLVCAVVVIAKAFALIKALMAPVSAFLPAASMGGIAIVNIVSTLAILCLCYAAGRVASRGGANRVQQYVDEKLLTLFPRYAFIKSMTESFGTSEGRATLQPVKVRFDDYCQIAFEVERDAHGVATLYLPGAPDPWSGSIAYVDKDRVELLDAKFSDVIQSLRKVGRGSSALLA